MNNNPQFSHSYSNLANGYYNYPANQWYQPAPYNITPNGNVPSLVTLSNSSTTTTNSKNTNNNYNSSINVIQPTTTTQPPPYTIYPPNTQYPDTRARSAPPSNYYQSPSFSLPPSNQFSPSNFSPPPIDQRFPTGPAPPTTNQCSPTNLSSPPPSYNQCFPPGFSPPPYNQCPTSFSPPPPYNQCPTSFSPPPPYNQCSPPGFSPPSYNQSPPTSFSPPPTNLYPPLNIQHSSSNGNLSNCSTPSSPTHTQYPPSPTHYCPYPYGYPSLINHFATYQPPPPLDYIPKYIDDQCKERICTFLDLPYDPRANANNNPFLKGGYFGTVYSVMSDGNCFFRCISQELTGQQTYHSKLRAKLCEFMENHREKFEAYVDCSFSKHLRRMKREGTWATHAEIFGMATLLGCSIYVNTKYGFTTEWLQHDPVFQYHTPLPGYQQQPALGKIYVIHVGEVHFNLFVV